MDVEADKADRLITAQHGGEKVRVTRVRVGVCDNKIVVDRMRNISPQVSHKTLEKAEVEAASNT